MKIALAFAVVVTLTVPAAVSAQTGVPVTPEQQRRQDEITVLEGTLTSSVSLAATKVAKEVQSSTPNATLFTGRAQAKGFLLEGFGVFFSVEIPALDLNVMLTIENIEKNAKSHRGLGASNNLPNVNMLQEPGSRDSQPDTAASAVIDSMVAADPGQKSWDDVKLALIDSMLDHSKNLELAPDEWLTIAARGSEAGLLPNEIFQLSTVILRVKGSDLADYLGGRLTKAEARRKVEVRQF
ncbi:MAG: hypothetical protein ABJC89_10735 [Acidobacteriota bacterium]